MSNSTTPPRPSGNPRRPWLRALIRWLDRLWFAVSMAVPVYVILLARPPLGAETLGEALLVFPFLGATFLVFCFLPGLVRGLWEKYFRSM